MAQQHGDRLSAVDASFLAQESESAHMHVGAVTLFEGPPPAYEDFVDQIRGRLHYVPRYRQKLAIPPMETGRPLWVDDTSFNLEYHVRHTALPKPGSEEQLRALAARVHSQRLDRSKPLWEIWLVQGLEDNRFALIFKTHHALVDGVAGVDLATVLLDLTPVPSPAAHQDEPWVPRREPSPVDLAARGVRGLVSAPLKLATRAAVAATRPNETFEATRVAMEGLGEVAWATLNPAPPTPLNVEIGPHRRLLFVRNDLEDFKRVKDAFGTTVNDVVLATVAGALSKWLRLRGVRTEGLELRALVPVSIRTEDQHHQLGNRIAAMRGPLPVYVDDPVARLRVVKQAMDGLKDSKQAVGAEVLAAAQNFAPPTILAQASRLNFSTRLFNLLVTNVPGPQFPLYLLGRQMLDLFPVAFLPKHHALAVAIMSYNGRMDFGLLGDYDALPDLELIGDAMQESLRELLDAAAAAEPTARGSRAGVG
jgi:diacylglycerol O-acyltransferase / wax synthase